MKTVILAGGKGTRGRPFTDYFPKAMIPVEGKPLIDHIVQYLSAFSFIDEIIILSDYKGLGIQIKRYFENRKDIKKIRFVQDSNSGTGGDLVHLSGILKREFVLWFVDNLCGIDLDKMYKFYKEKKSLACIATRSYRREETGFAVVKDGVVIEFNEKPVIKLPAAECLGIYILDAKILKIIKSKSAKRKKINLSSDIFEELSKKRMISAFDIDKTSWMDIESPNKIEREKEVVKKIIKEMRS